MSLASSDLQEADQRWTRTPGLFLQAVRRQIFFFSGPVAWNPPGTAVVSKSLLKTSQNSGKYVSAERLSIADLRPTM